IDINTPSAITKPRVSGPEYDRVLVTTNNVTIQSGANIAGGGTLDSTFPGGQSMTLINSPGNSPDITGNFTLSGTSTTLVEGGNFPVNGLGLRAFYKDAPAPNNTGKNLVVICALITTLTAGANAELRRNLTGAFGDTIELVVNNLVTQSVKATDVVTWTINTPSLPGSSE